MSGGSLETGTIGEEPVSNLPTFMEPMTSPQHSGKGMIDGAVHFSVKGLVDNYLEVCSAFSLLLRN